MTTSRTASLKTFSMALLSTVTLVACAAPPAPAVEPTARVIVRFRPGVADPTNPAFLAGLAARANVTRIETIRPMSGESFVMQVACADPRTTPAPDACDAALVRLGAVDAILFIERDRKDRIS